MDRGRRVMFAALLLVMSAASLVDGQLVMSIHNNTALGLPALEVKEVAVLAGAVPVRPLQSASFLGQIVFPPGSHGGLNFSAETDGIVRLWVDDHLVLDDVDVSKSGATRSITTWVAFPGDYPPAAQSAPVPFRLEYTRVSGSGEAGTIRLLWAIGDVGEPPSAPAVLVPAGSFRPALTVPQQKRENLRQRLYEPQVPWQTYAVSSMVAHTLCPTGFVLRFTLLDVVTREVLGDVKPFQRFTPAHVLPGRHSLNGSDYTSLTVKSWLRQAVGGVRNASVVLETTAVTADGQRCNGTAGSGGARCDLLVGATCSGADCGNIGIVAYADYQWARMGSPLTATAPGTLVAQPAGFHPVSVHSVGGRPLKFSAMPGVAGDAMALAFVDDGVVAFSTGMKWSLSDHTTAIARARALASGVPATVASTDTARLFLPMRDVLAWNTVYTHALHVYTPVSRAWAQGDDGGTTFVWDVFFAAIMLGTDSASTRARDIAHANVITTVMSRTVTGMVPNYRTGKTCTYDRTEPMLGGWTLQILHEVFGDQWVADLLVPQLVRWNNWTWERRLAGGVLAVAGDPSFLISLGSDTTSPAGLNTPHTLAAARYESGLDNSPMYDGNDHPGGEDQGAGPIRFNATTSHMELYDIAFSVYHGLDSQMLARLCANTNRTLARLMQERATRVLSAVNTDLFDPRTQQYCNRMYNGSFYCRWSPTSFAPMLPRIVAPGPRLNRLVELLESPGTFCVNSSHSGSGPPQAAILWRMSGVGPILPSKASVTCTTEACLQTTVLSVAQFEAVEATVASAASADDSVPLELFRSLRGLTALVTPKSAAALPAEYIKVGVEGWCADHQGSPSLRRVPLSLWQSNDSAVGYRTCGGSTECGAAQMASAGYRVVDPVLCYVYPAATAEDIPCKIALPSISRNDTAFWDQIYWRGRQWAPQTFLVWAGLRQYTDDVGASMVRKVLVEKAVAQFEQELGLFGQVNENMNGVLGCGSDSPRADGYYHWGALNAFVAIADAGAYPSPTLMGTTV